MKNCKLSDRFVRNFSTTLPVVDESGDNILEDDYLSKLLKKVNSIPVWHEYTKEEQENLSLKFIQNNFDPSYNGLSQNVIGLGVIHSILENSNVTEVLVEDGCNVKIVIDENLLDTEIQLSDLQRIYLKNCFECFKNKIYCDNKFNAEITSPVSTLLVVKKV